MCCFYEMNVKLCPYRLLSRYLSLSCVLYLGPFYLVRLSLNTLVCWYLSFPSWCVANPAVLSVAVPIALPPAHQMH